MRCYAVVWQHVIGMLYVLFGVLSAVLCGGVSACHRYGVCTVRCVESVIKFNKECICWCMNFIEFVFLTMTFQVHKRNGALQLQHRQVLTVL